MLAVSVREHRTRSRSALDRLRQTRSPLPSTRGRARRAPRVSAWAPELLSSVFQWIGQTMRNAPSTGWLAHAALTLVLLAPAAQGPRHAPRDATGIRPRDAVEVAFAARTHPAALEQAPRVRRVPPRAGTSPSPFVAPPLPAAGPTDGIAQAGLALSAPDPRIARRPPYYANAPPRSGSIA